METEQPRVALVTGGGQGIGRAVAQWLVGHGWAVVLAEADREAGEEAAAALSGAGAATFVATDVSSEPEVQAAVSQTLERHGRLDALVNNAGIAKAHGPAPQDLDLEVWNRTLAVNLTGPFLCAKHCIDPLRETRGAIVNIASTRALMSEGHTEAYSASKGGVVALTHALAVSLGPDVRVNCVSPGWIDVSSWKKRSARYDPGITAEDHAQHPAGRVGCPEDVAAIVGFLLSPEAAFITGANFMVDGGMTRKMIYLE